MHEFFVKVRETKDLDGLYQALKDKKILPQSQDKMGVNSLILAIDAEFPSDFILKLLDSFDFDVSIEDITGMTPLHYAVMLESEEVVSHLIKKGANPYIKDFESWEDCFKAAEDCENKEIANILKTTLHVGAPEGGPPETDANKLR
jgi:ankyrin repeat protein